MAFHHYLGFLSRTYIEMTESSVSDSLAYAAGVTVALFTIFATALFFGASRIGLVEVDQLPFSTIVPLLGALAAYTILYFFLNWKCRGQRFLRDFDSLSERQKSTVGLVTKSIIALVFSWMIFEIYAFA